MMPPPGFSRLLKFLLVLLSIITDFGHYINNFRNKFHIIGHLQFHINMGCRYEKLTFSV